MVNGQVVNVLVGGPPGARTLNPPVKSRVGRFPCCPRNHRRSASQAFSRCVVPISPENSARSGESAPTVRPRQVGA